MKPTREQLQEVIEYCEKLLIYEPTISDPESRRSEKYYGEMLENCCVSFVDTTKQYMSRTSK